ncbi:copper resistance CopC/CopD family protein [Streptomyces sp. B3I8]|uniref:copper resistance CopC/CopD family protein n=1 Tax=Streptomyces sp. B3I8 TaxID=3042303 RepID=UPI00278322A3|nr:copper resistance protein CopC [Streptomyces sp. B3I8]MDQ0787930.1 copper transport protein [Streptomyces sp. B3I8]
MDAQRDRGSSHPHLTRALTLLGATLLLLLATVSIAATPASAHAVLTSSTPQDGTVVRIAPRTVTLTFSESVGLLDDSFRVLDHTNRRLHTGRPTREDGRGDTARITLPARMGKGTFTIGWRVVSADSHPVSGAFTFSIGKPSPSAAVLPAEPSSNGASTVLYDIARYFAYGGIALLIGVFAFAATTGLEPARGPARLGWWTLLAATVALFLLRGPYERGTGPATALDPTLLDDTAATRPGLVLLVRLPLLAAAVFFPLRRREGEPLRERLRLTGGALLALALALTWAMSEHASAGLQVPVAITSAVLHLLSMAAWLGGLVVLLTTLYRSPEKLPAGAVTRFSRLAFTSVVVLVATGVYQSWRGLGSLDTLTTTTYGRLLTAKLLAVVVLLAAAAYSRRFTARPAAPREATAPARAAQNREPHAVASLSPDAESAGRRRLRTSVLAEVTVGVMVLMVTTLLTGTQPGRAETEAVAAQEAASPILGASAAVPFVVGAPGGRGKAQVDLTPGRAGENTVQVVTYGPDDGIVTVPEVRLTFTLGDQKLGPLDAKLEDQGGYWTSDALNLPLPGVWTMKVTVRTTDVDQVTVKKDIRIG